MHYLIKFHNTDGFIFIEGNCIAEVKFKLSNLLPNLYVRKIEVFEDYEFYIDCQKASTSPHTKDNR